MLISHKHKFVVFDIPKTCTLSMYVTLKKLDIVDVGGVMDFADSFAQHANYVSCQRGFENNNWNLKKYFTFTKVRNPWARYVSLMLYQKRKADEYKRASEEELKTWKGVRLRQGKFCLQKCNSLGSDENLLKDAIHNSPSQYEYTANKNGEVTMDLIGTVENIEYYFKKFCSEVGINPLLKLEHSNKGYYKKPFTDYYNQELTDLVAEKEKWVINKFNYQL